MKNQKNIVIVTFENGHELTKEIKATMPEIIRFYELGKFFDVGNVNGGVQAVKKCTVFKPNLKVERNV